jgi:hypothetical protein
MLDHVIINDSETPQLRLDQKKKHLELPNNHELQESLECESDIRSQSSFSS